MPQIQSRGPCCLQRLFCLLSKKQSKRVVLVFTNHHPPCLLPVTLGFKGPERVKDTEARAQTERGQLRPHHLIKWQVIHVPPQKQRQPGVSLGPYSINPAPCGHSWLASIISGLCLQVLHLCISASTRMHVPA